MSPARVRCLATRLARLAPLALVLLTGACAYFNGVYNARYEVGQAERRLRAGEEDAARGHWLAAAEKAESVLVRHRKSKWVPTALYLAGRGAALGGNCEQGEPRLRQYLALDGQPREERELAELALATCEVRAGRLLEARARLERLLTHRNPDVARMAALWSARAAVRVGDMDAAVRYLARVDAAAAQWELVGAALDLGAWQRAESLLAQRAARGDYRDVVLTAIGQLWTTGRHEGVEALLTRYERAGAPAVARVKMHLRLGELAAAGGLDTVAQRHLETAQRLSGDPNVDRESSARLLELRAAAAESLPQLHALVRGAERTLATNERWRRLADNLMLAEMLWRHPDPMGSTQFLAAEVLRDSLRATRAAHRLLRFVADSARNSPVAPLSLLAAAQLVPESTSVYHARIRREYGATPAALMLDGLDPANLPVWRLMNDRFRDMWTLKTRQYRDSLSRLRPTDAQTAGTPLP